MKMLVAVLLFTLVAVSNANIYYGFVKEAPNNPILISSNVSSSETRDPINPGLQTIVLLHGQDGDVNADSNQMATIEILSNRAANVIVVDWSLYAKQSYSTAVKYVPAVGHELAEFLIHLERQGKIRYDNLHLVGFDLGAHVAGNAGREIATETGNQVARITGLDPNGSQWGSRSPRLKISDASYVEVIHTDGDGLLAIGIGTALGHVDFYVNGGSSQPGCLTHACSHNRAYELFAGTFSRPERLYGNFCTTSLQLTMNRCTSQPLHVGDDDMNKSRVDGVYRVNTGRSYPY